MLVKPYKITVQSKSKNYKYEIIENNVFTILENKSQQIKPEVTNQPSKDEKRNHYNQLMLRINIKTNMQVLQIWNQIKI